MPVCDARYERLPDRLKKRFRGQDCSSSWQEEALFWPLCAASGDTGTPWCLTRWESASPHHCPGDHKALTPAAAVYYTDQLASQDISPNSKKQRQRKRSSWTRRRPPHWPPPPSPCIVQTLHTASTGTWRLSRPEEVRRAHQTKVGLWAVTVHCDNTGS